MMNFFDLERFIRAQDPVLEDVRAELRDGCKVSHWIWFVFPQLRGLGRSSTANHFGISSRAEAEAYLVHSILGPRLRECVALVNHVEHRSAEQIFGHTDALKFRSCVTLFGEVASDKQVFVDALQKYFAGQGDPLTLDRLRAL